VKKSWTFNGLIGTAALLLPLTAATESDIRSGAPGRSLSATAQINFKIVIPKVLFLQVAPEANRVAGINTVTVMSNSHNVDLNASLRTAHSDGSVWGNIILSTGARKAIAQKAACTLDGQGALTGSRLICTASMP
jgi:hypothetical protein